MSSITNLTIAATLNAKINEIKNKRLQITNLVTTSAPTAVENKITVDHDHGKYIYIYINIYIYIYIYMIYYYSRS